MYCSKCQTQNENGSAFCRNCGTALQTNVLQKHCASTLFLIIGIIHTFMLFWVSELIIIKENVIFDLLKYVIDIDINQLIRYGRYLNFILWAVICIGIWYTYISAKRRINMQTGGLTAIRISILIYGAMIAFCLGLALFAAIFATYIFQGYIADGKMRYVIWILFILVGIFVLVAVFFAGINKSIGSISKIAKNNTATNKVSMSAIVLLFCVFGGCIIASIFALTSELGKCISYLLVGFECFCIGKFLLKCKQEL